MAEKKENAVRTLTARNYDYDNRIAALTPEEREKYQKIGELINVNDTNSVQTYGSELSKTIAKCGDTLLSSVRSTNGDELTQLVNNLLSELNLINIDDLNTDSKAKAFLKRIPILRRLVQSVETAMIKYDTIAENVDKISKKIDSTRLVALRDNTTLQTIFNSDKEYITQLREYILAAKMKLKQIEGEVETMLANPDEHEIYDVKSKMSFANALEKRITDMQTTEYTLTQSLMQIEAIASGNDQLAQQADNIVNNVLPIWKSQLANSVMLANQRASSEAQKKTSETTNYIIRTNAEKIHQNAVEIAKASEDPVIQLETLEHTTKELIQTLKDVKQIHKEGAEKRKNVEKALKGYTQQLEAAVADLQ